MPKLTPINYKQLAKVFERAGFIYDRQKGDHLIYVKAGIFRAVVIPMYQEIPVFIIKNNLRTAGISRDEYFKLLEQV